MAFVARPPSPLYPVLPLPATVVITPVPSNSPDPHITPIRDVEVARRVKIQTPGLVK